MTHESASQNGLYDSSFFLGLATQGKANPLPFFCGGGGERGATPLRENEKTRRLGPQSSPGPPAGAPSSTAAPARAARRCCGGSESLGAALRTDPTCEK